LIFISWFGIPLGAQILPFKTFTISDGLAHNTINQIFQDPKGYLWLATAEGLSRFDGYAFRNYGREDGLGGSYINDIAGDRNGRLWVAINDGGIARFLDENELMDNERSGKKFVSYSISSDRLSNNVGRIVIDSEDRMWCATEGGVFRARATEIKDGDFDLIAAPDVQPRASREAFVDGHGRLWFGFNGGILEIAGGETRYHELEPQGTRDAFINGITENNSGRLYAATSLAVYEFVEEASTWQTVGLSFPKGQTIRTIDRADDGGLWVGTNVGLIHYRNGHQTPITQERPGLCNRHLHRS
jgi:ligand-binding sensor domain-containing protein